MDDHEMVNSSKFYLTAAVICTIGAVPIISGLINSSFANFLTIAVLVISVMILLRRQTEDFTKIPCVLGVAASILDAVNFILGRTEQYTLLGFLSDYTFPIDLTADIFFTERQMDALGLVMLIGATSLISWVFITVAAILYFINYSRSKKILAAASGGNRT